MAGIPAQLGLNPDETEVYNSMIPRETFEFNTLPDNNAKITYIRAFVARDRTWRERSHYPVHTYRNLAEYDVGDYEFSDILRPIDVITELLPYRQIIRIGS
ncbi:33269_t:CDS:2 [Gigaspora margarita]|uniref:33269_t:CDS:1 n=1 Tax=Gigaspora margarita TaxID=4874 RepID=A0ABM8W752_GIGMA|nr:33269_t:CDS:2 [Gigaspora margarita]